MLVSSIYLFSPLFFACSDTNVIILAPLNLLSVNALTLSQKQILDSPKLKDFADDNSKLDENGRKFSKWVESTVGKGEIA